MSIEFNPEIEIEGAMTKFFAKGFYQPIADLCCRLVDPSLPREQVSDYAMAIVPLLVFSFESSITRLFLAKERSEHEPVEDLLRRVGAMKDDRTAWRKLSEDIALDSELAKSLREVYDMRDAVAHAHFFVEDSRIESDGGTIRPGFQGRGRSRSDRPFYEAGPVVDPSRFDRADVAKCFAVLDACFDALVQAGFSDVRVQVDKNVDFAGESLAFWSLGERVSAVG